MLKDFLLFIKYPYTAGIIAVLWLGSATLLAIEKELNSVQVIGIVLIATLIIAIFGFKGKQQL